MMDYEQFKRKEKKDLITNKKTGKISQKKIIPDKVIDLKKIMNKDMVTIELTKKDEETLDFITVSNYDEQNIRTAKFNIKHFAFEEKKYYNVKIENMKSETGILKKILENDNNSFWQIKVVQIYKDGRKICDSKITVQNSQEDMEIRKILENSNNTFEQKMLELLRLYRYTRIKNIIGVKNLNNSTLFQ